MKHPDGAGPKPAVDIVANERRGQGARAQNLEGCDELAGRGRAALRRTLEESGQVVAVTGACVAGEPGSDPADDATGGLTDGAAAGEEPIDGLARVLAFGPGAQRGKLRRVWEPAWRRGLRLLVVCCYGPTCFHARQFTAAGVLTR